MSTEAEARAWLTKLEQALNMQTARVERLEMYYDGQHPLPLVANSSTIKEAELAYSRLLHNSITNWVSLVADAPAERLSVIGLRYSDEVRADAGAWSIWQRNQLDADQQLIHDGALQMGNSYAIVWSGADGKATVSVEHPAQMIVAYAAGSRRDRVAALKRWIDDDGRVLATVYLPDGLFKFQATTKPTQVTTNAWGTAAYPSTTSVEEAQMSWEVRDVPGEDWPLANPLGKVNVVEYRANPKLRPAPFGGGVSEFAKVIPIQDRINRTLFGRLITQEFQSFRQRWATGMEPPVDPKTGEAINPYKPGATSLWINSDEQVKFGEFSEADLTGFLSAAEADVRHMAAITKTPPFYLLGEMVNVSGDALTASEAGLTRKVKRHQANFGEAHEEVLRLCDAVEGNAHADDMESQVIWAEAEERSLPSIADAVLKLANLGIPEEILWSYLPGVSQQDIARWRQTKDAETWFGREGFGVPGTPPQKLVAPPESPP